MMFRWYRKLCTEERVVTTTLIVTAVCQTVTVVMFAGLLYHLYFVGC